MVFRQNRRTPEFASAGSSHRAATVILIAVILAMILSSPASAELEAYNLFGAGAISASMGGASVGSDRDTLDFLMNPALITRYGTSRYTLSMMNYEDTYDLRDYKQTIFSLAKNRKGYSLLLDDDGGINRDMFIFTTALPYGSGKKYAVGINAAAFRFSTPVMALGAQSVASDDGSGFTIDVGVFRDFGRGIQAGLSLSNIISTGSETETQQTRREFELPRVYNLSIRYPAMKSMDLLLAYKSYSFSSASEQGSDSGSLIFFGGEYKLDNPLSARGGYMKESEFLPIPDEEDQSAPMGISYTTDKYNAGITAHGYHDSFESANGLLISYKKDADSPWKIPLEPEEPEDTIAEKQEQVAPEVKYEAPLPAAEKIEPEEDKPEKNIYYEDTEEDSRNSEYSGSDEEDENEPARPRTKVASFSVDPKVMIIPQASAEEVEHVSGHWSEKHVNSLAERGFYTRGTLDAFAPAGQVGREEFYRLVFLSQVTRLFDSPVVVLFNTPYPVSAEMWLSAPTMDKPILIQEGTYDRAGQKRLVVNRDLLDEHEVFAGKYKLRLKLAGNNMRPEELEDYITVLDTSMDFSSLVNLSEADRKTQIRALKRNMENLGINVDYLDGLEKSGPITRTEALRSLFAAAGVTLPTEYKKEDLFEDAWSLAEEDQAAVFLASRGMPSLAGMSLMNGYPDNTFKPDNVVTGAEAAALIDRFRKLRLTDFEKPYRVAIKPPAYKPPPAPESLETLVSETVEEQPNIISQMLADMQLPMENAKYFITVGSFMSEENSNNAVNILVNRGYTPEIFVERLGTIVARHVVLGRYESEPEARAALQKMKPVHEFDFKVVSISGGETLAMAASPARQPRPPQALHQALRRHNVPGRLIFCTMEPHSQPA